MEGRILVKRNEQVEEIEDFKMGGVWVFFFIIKNLYSLEELKNCIGGEF